MSNSTYQSWKKTKNYQPIDYPDQNELEICIKKLNQQATFIPKQEILQLKELIAHAALGNAFIIQGGDCAELIDYPIEYSLATVKLLNELREKIQSQLNIETVNIGRIAGQFAKPRSNILDTSQIPSYRGDMINQAQACSIARKIDPNNMLRAFAKASQIYARLTSLPQQKSQLLNTYTPNIFTSHEAYNLNYETACTKLGDDANWYNLATHFPWVGVRTKQIDGAHVEYLANINNPIAIKIDIATSSIELGHLIAKLNPKNTPGRISLITRLGKNQAHLILPSLINYTKLNNLNVTWLCDPMHGNIHKQDNNKVRFMEDIQNELLETQNVHQQHGSILAGIHIECTMENIRECVSKNQQQLNAPLVDPRLNRLQAHTIIDNFITNYYTLGKSYETG